MEDTYHSFSAQQTTSGVGCRTNRQEVKKNNNNNYVPLNFFLTRVGFSPLNSGGAFPFLLHSQHGLVAYPRDPLHLPALRERYTSRFTVMYVILAPGAMPISPVSFQFLRMILFGIPKSQGWASVIESRLSIV